MENLKKKGFPLEVEVTEILRSKGWSVSNQVPFIDPEENKHRMVDILGSKAIVTSGRKMATLDLILECKKNVKPWVFHISKFLEPLTEKMSLLRSLGTNVVGPSDKELTNLASRYIETQLRKP